MKPAEEDALVQQALDNVPHGSADPWDDHVRLAIRAAVAQERERAEKDAIRYRTIVEECLILDNDCTQGCYSAKSGITGEYVYTPDGDFRWPSYDAAVDAAAIRRGE